MDGVSGTGMSVSGLAKHACSYCRQKKIKCSKELPKCAACKPWPGPCIYNKEAPPIRATLAKGGNGEHEETKGTLIKPQSDNVSVNARLGRIEAKLGQITSVLEHLVKLSETNHGVPPVKRNADPPRRSEETLQPETVFEDTSHEDSPRSIHLVGSLSQTSQDLNKRQAYPELVAEHENASRELRGLLDSLNSFDIVEDKASEINPGSQYFVPDKQTGYSMVLRVTDLGSALFEQPTDEIVRQVIFEPNTVKDKAWLLYINYTMVAIASGTENQFERGFVNSLRWNTRLALNNASIFLEPSELNIQALLLAAVHGEDFAAPNLSWMLIGHACQQAKALLSSTPIQEFRGQQRRLCLFWSLFSVDKSCSLAFGRPVFLPASIFKAIPLPDAGYLLSHNPHREKSAPLGDSKKVSVFGANVLLQTISLSLLTSKISEFLHEGGSDIDRKNLIEQLDNWHRSTEELLSNAMESERSFSTPSQLHEMSLGILSNKFRYLHLLILLTENSLPHADIRVASAREALSLLPRMVSNWTQVYNGIIWQSLYYPFTPFFVIFQRILQSPSAVETKDDLRLLASTVAYFASMEPQVNALGPLVRKLEHTAEVLLRLAQRHVMVSASNQGSGTNARNGMNLDGMFPSKSDTGQQPLLSMESMAMPPFMEDIDMDSFISWLPQEIGSDLDLSGFGECAWDMPNSSQQRHHGGGDSEPRGKKRPFESAFDWFSWDTQFM